MHFIKRLFSLFGLQISRTSIQAPQEFIKKYNRQFAYLKKISSNFNIYKGIRYDKESHPANFIDYECGFAAKHLRGLNPKKILDIGSYRHLLIGLMTSFEVTTLDVRERKPISENEIVVTADAKKMPFSDNEFDVVISLCSLEHFGLGRYGDEFDFYADRKAFGEMVRVLKLGGSLIFTTMITRARPSIVFNAHRIYNYEMIKEFTDGLTCEEETFYSNKIGDYCTLEEVTEETQVFDVYCGCWRKEIKK